LGQAHDVFVVADVEPGMEVRSSKVKPVSG